MENFIPAASIYAWQQLQELNQHLYKQEVTDWLHSEAAEPVLSQLLANVPCSATVH